MKRELLLAGGGAAALGLAGYQLIRRISEQNLAGQVALITGSSRGLGFLLAREFQRQGCRIVLCARDQAALDQARRELGGDSIAIRCDVTDREQVANLVRQAKRHFGRIDILVNNAGVIQVGPMEKMKVEDFENALRVMFWGVLYPTLEVLPDMLARRSGRIANITSIGGKVAVPHLLPYACAKFAAVGFSEGLRAELHKDGIRVTTVVPGLMRTGSHLNAWFKGDQDREYAWFSVSASTPGVSMNAERAARQIVRAVRRGEAERTLSLPATALARFHGLFPGLTADLLGLTARLLPKGGSDQLTRGRDVHEKANSRVLTALTGLGRAAAARYQHENR